MRFWQVCSNGTSYPVVDQTTISSKREISMKRVGFIGWRGMVGSVLMQRMREENDFALVEPTFFSTSQKGGKAPDIGQEAPPLKDANDIDELRSMDILISCQGGDYTGAIF